jgi:membrane protease YdiL (CAAX protease family)
MEAAVAFAAVFAAIRLSLYLDSPLRIFSSAVLAAVLFLYVPVPHYRKHGFPSWTRAENPRRTLGTGLLLIVAGAAAWSVYAMLPLPPELAPPRGAVPISPALAAHILLLTALPEEIFFRGYLYDLFEEAGREPVIPTALLFAVGHLVIHPSPYRLLTFFPGLLLGWGRKNSGNARGSGVSGGLAVSGHLFFFYAYEAGFEISLDAARSLCEASEAPGISGLRPSPPHLQYRPRPLVVPAGEMEAVAGGRRMLLDASVKIFDFGALSVTLSLPVRDLPWEEYCATALALSAGPGLERSARETAGRVFERIRPAISRPMLADLVEEYSLWHVSSFAPPMTGTEALAGLSQDIARLLTLQEGKFSGAAVAEILRSPIQYFDNDLFVADWSASFAYDPKFQDTLEVLEFLNVQLLELRFFDRLLLGAIDATAQELHPRRRLFHILHDPYAKPMHKLSQIRTDVSMVRERIYNSLKLAGDAYLARVYEEARKKVGAEKYDGSVRDKLATLTEIYTVLNNQAQASRAETLEMIIILLIAIEIVIGLLLW